MSFLLLLAIIAITLACLCYVTYRAVTWMGESDE